MHTRTIVVNILNIKLKVLIKFLYFKNQIPSIISQRHILNINEEIVFRS